MGENTEEKKEARKNMNWSYNAVSHMLTATFPSKRETHYNLTERVRGMAFTDELIYQYGIRQWLSSNAASLKEEEEKIESFRKDFEEMVKNGLELSDGGNKISVVGRERANAGATSETKKAQKEMLNTAVSLVSLMQKQMAGVATEEEVAKLQELLGAAEALSTKIKK